VIPERPPVPPTPTITVTLAVRVAALKIAKFTPPPPPPPPPDPDAIGYVPPKPPPPPPPITSTETNLVVLRFIQVLFAVNTVTSGCVVIPNVVGVAAGSTPIGIVTLVGSTPPARETALVIVASTCSGFQPESDGKMTEFIPVIVVAGMITSYPLGLP
jgi:hypothetical protein